MKGSASRIICLAVVLLLLQPAVAGAADATGEATAANKAAAAASADTKAAETAGGLSVDVRFDKTGDGIVDASDWAQMDAATKLEYARESVAALGEDPDALLEGRRTRAERYLDGLRAVYE